MGRMGVWFLVQLALSSVMGMLVRVQGQDQNPGFISIDCGAPNDYTDKDLGIFFKKDDGFVDSGINVQISTEFIYENKRAYGKNMRVFPNGTRNCYTLRPEQGKDNLYLIRAEFNYGNYDNQNQPPIFDLHIGVNYWTTVEPSVDWFFYEEVMYVSPTDDIQVCLIKTGHGIPFISSLQLRLIDDSIYQLNTAAVINQGRLNIGSLRTFRYPFDVYDRIWTSRSYTEWVSMNTTESASLRDDDSRVPAEVLSTAQRAPNVTSPMSLQWPANITEKWCIYFHFAELESLPDGQRREFEIFVNGNLTNKVTLEYGQPVTISSGYYSQPVIGQNMSFSINATNRSGQYPPILNAVEAFTVLELPTVPTALDDVNAIYDIKKMYGIKRDGWQGDPCVPNDYAWDGLNCTYGNPPRIVSLNLSSSSLTGDIAASFSHLLELNSLDLSCNQLTGPIPELLAKLPNLIFLNLNGNNLTGYIPESLKKKIADHTLNLSVEDNPNLCLEDSCKPKKRTSITVPVIAAASVLVALLLIALAIIWRVRTKGKGHAEGTIRSKNRPFTRREVLNITDNFKTVIGEGGFGKVYLGTLVDGAQVAVKMLSRTSSQGYKEFQAEAELLIYVHHRNLVSLIGYCDEAKHMALVYEFMANGNVRHHLADQSSNKHVLTWSERLRIAIDAAHGLDYLHNGCKPPIIHRDLKTSNILLTESMQAKISDFGLSKAFAADNDSHISTRPIGTPGYLDPEFQSSGNLNKKSDVYSFGIILFELITGQPALLGSTSAKRHILQRVIPMIEKGNTQSVVDSRLDGKFNVESALKFVEIAKSCVLTTAVHRPDISRVLDELRECWDMEMALERSRGLESNKAEPTESFEISSREVDYNSVPSAT